MTVNVHAMTLLRAEKLFRMQGPLLLPRILGAYFGLAEKNVLKGRVLGKRADHVHWGCGKGKLYPRQIAHCFAPVEEYCLGQASD